MKMNIRIILLFFIVASTFTSENVLACSYDYIPSVYQSYSNASFVFVGKPIELKIVDGQRIYRFETIEIFKGSEKLEVEINNGYVENMCDSGFTIGESYLIYAGGKDEKNLFTGNFASLNEPLINAQDQIHFLRELLKGKRESQIYGSVMRNDNNPNGFEARVTPLENIRVKVEGKGKLFETVTDANGLYYFNKIPKGEYTIKTVLPNIYKNYLSNEETILVLKSGRVVTGENMTLFLQLPKIESQLEADFFSRGQISDGTYSKFSVLWNNQLKRKVVDLEGREVFAETRLIPISKPFEKFSDNIGVEFGESGLRGITPAKYYLVTEINAPFSGKDKIRYFYPQTEKPEEAIVIDIKGNDKLEFDFIIPLVKRSLEGKIYWSDGTPIAGEVRIVLSKSEKTSDLESDENIFFGVTNLDISSSFLLPVYVGAEYWLHTIVFAENYDSGKLKLSRIETKPIKIKVEKIIEPLKILIPKPDK